MLKLKLQYFGHVMQRTNSLEKTRMLRKFEYGKRRGVTEDEMVGWHHRFSGQNLSKLWDIVKDREAWSAAAHGITNSQTGLSD